MNYNLNYDFTTFENFKKAKAEKEKMFQMAEIEFEKQFNIATIDLTKDLLNTIDDKLLKIIKQFEDKELLNKINDKESQLEKLNMNLFESEKRKTDIISILSANLKEKKLITKLDKTNSGIYYVHISSGTSEYSKVLENEEDIKYADEYFECLQSSNNINNQINQLNEEFDKFIKNREYIEFNFSEEIDLLNKISRFKIYSINELDNNKHYLLYGTKEDYELYNSRILEIENNLKKYYELKKSL